MEAKNELLAEVLYEKEQRLHELHNELKKERHFKETREAELYHSKGEKECMKTEHKKESLKLRHKILAYAL